MRLNFGQRILLAADKFRTYKHSKVCKKCKNYLICDGPEREYVKAYGFNELKSDPGRYIKDPLHYRKNFYRDLDLRFM